MDSHMTPMEKFRDFYKSVGVPLSPAVFHEGRYCIQIKAGDYHNLNGKRGSFTEAFFDANGDFIEQVFW
jgi:hypothetical protein